MGAATLWLDWAGPIFLAHLHVREALQDQILANSCRHVVALTDAVSRQRQSFQPANGPFHDANFHDAVSPDGELRESPLFLAGAKTLDDR